MKIYILFGRRYYESSAEYPPEVLEAIDEYSDDDNPDWIADKRKKHLESGDYSRVEIVCVDIGHGATKKIVEILNPEHIVSGEIKS